MMVILPLLVDQTSVCSFTGARHEPHLYATAVSTRWQTGAPFATAGTGNSSVNTYKRFSYGGRAVASVRKNYSAGRRAVVSVQHDYTDGRPGDRRGKRQLNRANGGISAIPVPARTFARSERLVQREVKFARLRSTASRTAFDVAVPDRPCVRQREFVPLVVVPVTDSPASASARELGR